MGPRPELAREGRGNLNPLTSTVGVVGEIGRTPIPVAESTCHPGEKPLPSVRECEGEEPDQTGESTTPARGQGRTVGEVRVTMKKENLSGHCPGPQTHVDLQR